MKTPRNLSMPPLLTLCIILVINFVGIMVAWVFFPIMVESALSKLAQMFTEYKWDRMVQVVGPLVLLMGIEVFFLGWGKSSIYRLIHPSKSALTDIVVAGWHILGFDRILVVLFTFGSAYIAREIAYNFLDLPVLHYIETPLLQFAFWLIAIDFIYYWYHRTGHMIGFLWETHKYHHAATEFNIITGNRIHALDEATEMFFLLIPIAILGAPLETYLGIMLLRRAIDIYQHSMLPWDFGWVGRWLIYSPIGHRIHHSMDREHWDLNFGNISPIWDRLFDTWYSGDTINEEVGIPNSQYNKEGIIADYINCFLKTVSVFWSSLQTGVWRRID